MNIWYLPPFLLAAVAYLVGTRKHDREWKFLALGGASGAVLMGLMVIISALQSGRSQDRVSTSLRSDSSLPTAVPSYRLFGDSAREALPPTWLWEGRGLGIGGLQFMYMGPAGAASDIVIEPADRVAHFGGRHLRIYRWHSEVDSAEAYAAQVFLGIYHRFGFRGRLYELNLLERKPEYLDGLIPARARIRLLDAGPNPLCNSIRISPYGMDPPPGFIGGATRTDGCD